ncbi:MAG: hypothetical protein QW424_05365 [Candidatus Bathyarchaeia archaeon]
MKKRKTKHMLRLLINEIIVSLLLAIIIDFELKTFAIVFLMLMLNIFAIPLAFIFPLPLWAWYVIVFMWIAELHYLIKEADEE